MLFLLIGEDKCNCSNILNNHPKNSTYKIKLHKIRQFHNKKDNFAFINLNKVHDPPKGTLKLLPWKT